MCRAGRVCPIIVPEFLTRLANVSQQIYGQCGFLVKKNADDDGKSETIA